MRYFVLLALTVLFGGTPAFGAFTSFSLNNAPVTSAYQGPADAVASPILFYGLRAVSNSYAVANGKLANIVRASDSHTCDVLAAAAGGLGNTANCSTGGDNGQTAAAFCPNTTTCTIATLYDQSGANACASAACDLTQATPANQPGLTFSCINTTLPCMAFGGNINVLLARSSSPSQIQPFTFASVWNQNGTCNASASNTCAIFVSDSAGTYIGFWVNSSSRFMRIEGGNGGAPTPNNAYNQNTWNNTQAVINGTASKLFFDGTAPALIGTPGTASMANSLKLGNDLFGGNGAFVGNIVEVGVWGPPGFTSVQQLALCTNQTSYYNLPGSCTSPPTVTLSPSSVSYTGGQASPVVLNSALAISSLQQSLTNATAQITGSLDSTNDLLALPTTSGITSAYTASTGTLLMTGPATVAAFQAALRTVTYSSAIIDPTIGGTKPTRTITWQVTE